MVDVVGSWFYIQSRDFDKDFLESRSSILFDRWDERVSQSLQLEDYSLTLVVEEGSIKGLATVVAPFYLLYFAIGQYGSFVSGVNAIYAQSEYVTTAIFGDAKDTFNLGDNPGNTRRKDGAVVYLKKLFNQVQAGRMTPEQAVQEVQKHFGDEAAEVPGFIEELEKSLRTVPCFPEQLTLEDETWPDSLDETTLKPLDGDRLPRRSSSSRPSHYRVEIVRESRRKEKIVIIERVK